MNFQIKLEEQFEQVTNDLRNDRNWLNSIESALLTQKPANESTLKTQTEDMKV